MAADAAHLAEARATEEIVESLNEEVAEVVDTIVDAAEQNIVDSLSEELADSAEAAVEQAEEVVGQCLTAAGRYRRRNS